MMSNANVKIDSEEDGCKEFVCKKDEPCQFEYGMTVCKCVEEFKKSQCDEGDDKILLPSVVIDQEFIYFPHTVTKEDPSIYGKWLIFTDGNLRLQDHLWIQLQNLIQSKLLILLESSTAKMCDNRGPYQGVIKCYTSKNISVIKCAGVAIQSILNDQTILNFKTNEATQKNLYRGCHSRFIIKFMITVNGKLYKKDKLCRWTQITDAEYQNFKFDEEFSDNALNQDFAFTKRSLLRSGSNLLPSLETSKKKHRYVYPDGAHFNDLSGIWCMFCNIINTDRDGLTELDHAWNQAKILCDEKVLKSVNCETSSFEGRFKDISLGRTVMCEVHDSADDKVIECADKLRERISYNMPMYFKFFLFNRAGKPQYKLKYLYTEDRELYEYSEDKWILFKRC